MDARRLAAVLVIAALFVNLGATLSAARIDPPGNDYLLHGLMVERAADALAEEGWASFQDPWFPELNGGYPLFHHYPHLPHHWTATVAAVFKVDPFTALSGANLLLVGLLPLLVFVGGGWLGLGRVGAAVAALAFATMRSLDGFGHTPMGYGWSGHGLFGQLWGMAFAALALPAWVAASDPSGAGLARLRPWTRPLLAGVLVSLVVRSSLPAGYLVGICSLAIAVVAGPVRELPVRLRGFAIAGGLAVGVSAGVLFPFVTDLGATNSTVLELVPERRDSVGALRVIGRLLRGYYLDGGLLVPWSTLLLGALVGAGVTWRERTPVERGLAVATVVAILLLFGRETWGQWMGSLPLLGRFHDHRYLLGLHLLAPWVIGAGVSLALVELRRRFDDRRALGGAAAVLALAVGLQGLQVLGDRTDGAGLEAQLAGASDPLDALLEEARAAPGRVALGSPDDLVGGTTRLSWLRRHGVPTFGRPLYHYSFVHDFALYWTEQTGRGTPTAAGLQAAGVGAVLPGGPTGPGEVAIVRADLAMRVTGSDLQGFAGAWFGAGLHERGQYPVLELGSDSHGGFGRTGTIDSRDPTVLDDLPAALERGEILSDALGERPGDRVVRVRIDNRPAWLLITTSWHPRWTVTVDDAPAKAWMLVPGWIGVPFDRVGEHTVSLKWRPSPWRGPWAAANVLLCAIALLLPFTTRRDF